jgi:demethylmenaquinone methyltransferase/2-methoxy-6-polyprenyl-1,4-benzoquinol methylase
MFNNIASRYDLTNSILSLSFHKRWNKKLIHCLVEKSSFSPVIVDLCAGTGDIAFGYLRSIQSPSQAYLIDFSAEMLQYAKKKEQRFPFLRNHSLSYIKADVQNIPLPSELADSVSIAYGIRNVQDPRKCIQEAFRILKPGGRLGIVELTRPKQLLLRLGHSAYLRIFLPFIGRCLTNNKQAYEYLKASIQQFLPSEGLKKLLKETGFSHIQSKPLLGGIATLFIADKG